MTKTIKKENGRVKAKVEIDRYGTTLSTCQFHTWTGVPMTPELARLTIETLQEYLAQ